MATNKVTQINVAGFGRLPLTAEGATFMPAGVSREHQPGMAASDGTFEETNTPATLSGNLVNRSDFDFPAFAALPPRDLTIVMANGDTRTMPQAVLTERPEQTNQTVSFTFMSNTSQ